MMQPPTSPGHDDVMMAEDGMEDGLEQTQQTQQATQPQYLSQLPNNVDAHLWGFLQPCAAALTRIDFWKANAVYDIGRNRDGNQIILPGFKVSNKHCKITWDGKEETKSDVIIQDLSSNGTFVNGEKVGKGRTRIIRDGNEIAFGTPLPQPQNDGSEDYRYVFRLIAAGPATEGIHAFYDLGVELGKGSFASVYKAMHRLTGQWYAVKMIQADKVKKSAANGNVDPRKATAFAREISILEQLSHPNICQLKETFFDDVGHNINLVLELVEGGDLLDYILSREGISEPAAKHITFQICDALAYIHLKGIAHRDLKPENVLLTKDNPPIVKVADFGLAKVVDSLTVLRTMCGTPSYLAPEVVMQGHNEGYSHLVDSWSVGVIVFSMLTNTSPFIEDENIPDLRTRIVERQVDWSALQRANVSADGQSFIRRLLDPRPTLRMTLDKARQHAWLQGYGPIQSRALTQSPSIESIIPGDQSMLGSVTDDDSSADHSNANGDPVSQEFEQMQLRQNGAPNGNAIRSEGSRTLQRRSNVLSQAAEDGDDSRIPQPSWEMISSSQAHDRAEENGAGPSTRVAKRKDHPMDISLTPMPEDEEWSAANGPPIDECNGADGSRRKGKGNGSNDPAQPRSARGTRAKKAEISSLEDEPPLKVRRSARQTPQKNARR